MKFIIYNIKHLGNPLLMQQVDFHEYICLVVTWGNGLFSHNILRPATNLWKTRLTRALAALSC